jgi:hypothetical protein
VPTDLDASFRALWSLVGMEAISHRPSRLLTALESVRCLACTNDYAKPVGGGTAATNPGCPRCGYLGWRPVTGTVEPPRYRFAAGPPQRRTA